jgi:hypothetical protein
MPRHAPVPVGCTGDDALEETEDAPDARDTVERRDEMHLAGAGIGKACRDAGLKQRPDYALGSVHE